MHYAIADRRMKTSIYKLYKNIQMGFSHLQFAKHILKFNLKFKFKF